METVRSPFLFGLVFLLSLQLARASSEPDHLLPADRSHDRPYFNLLHKKLVSTPFDYGRIIVRPPFTGEYSISIYAETSRDRVKRYHITMRTAQESLWQAALGGVNPSKAEGVKINQTDIFITSQLAGRLREVLTAMVDQTRELGADEKPNRIVIEGPLTDIMIIRRSGRVDEGQMGNFPPTTPKLRLLSKLITSLAQLCNSPDSKRPYLITEVTRDTEALRRQIAGR